MEGYASHLGSPRKGRAAWRQAFGWGLASLLVCAGPRFALADDSEVGVVRMSAGAAANSAPENGAAVEPAAGQASAEGAVQTDASQPADAQQGAQSAAASVEAGASAGDAVPASSTAASPSSSLPAETTPAFIPLTEPDALTASPGDSLGIRSVANADDPPPSPAGNAGDSINKAEKLGDAPPSNTLEFLRRQAVLLEAGQMQCDWGLTYSVFDSRFVGPDVNNGNVIENERLRARLMTIPFAIRYGVTQDLQFYANVPLGWSNTELSILSLPGANSTSNLGGLGDISSGFSYHLCKGCGAWQPDVITTIGFVAPTGNASFNLVEASPGSVLGQGYWQITSSVLFVHTLDPVVLFYGGGYVHRFDHTFSNNPVNPGEEFDYQFGVGFAVNPWVTLSTSLIGAYLTDLRVNDVELAGTDRDLLRFRFAVTVVKGKQIIEPFAEVAMTPESPSRVGVVFTY